MVMVVVWVSETVDSKVRVSVAAPMPLRVSQPTPCWVGLAGCLHDEGREREGEAYELEDRVHVVGDGFVLGRVSIVSVCGRLNGTYQCPGPLEGLEGDVCGDLHGGRC